MNEKYVSEDASLYIGLKAGTLGIWRCTKRKPQPAYFRIGNRIWYTKKDLDDFMMSQRVETV